MTLLQKTTHQFLPQLQLRFASVRFCYVCKPNFSRKVSPTSDYPQDEPNRRITAIALPVDERILRNTRSKSTEAGDKPQWKLDSATPEVCTAILNVPDLQKQMHSWPAIFLGLSKARLTSLVVSTALAGCALAIPTPFTSASTFLDHPATSLLGLCFGTGLTSASANTVNQIMEMNYDNQMKRTQSRPLVRGLITPIGAGFFAAVCAVSGAGLLYATTNPLVTCLGVGNVLLYTCVYTPMKRVSQVNTWVGSLVGAIPPLMGWATATGHLEWGSLMLAALLFAWQFPHFMALSWNIRGDYARAGFVMTSNVNPGLAKRVALRYSIVSCLVCLAGAGCSAVSLGPWAGWSLGLGTLPVNVALVYYAYQFYQATPEESSATARRLFRATLFHLPVCMTAMLICTHWSSVPLV